MAKARIIVFLITFCFLVGSMSEILTAQAKDEKNKEEDSDLSKMVENASVIISGKLFKIVKDFSFDNPKVKIKVGIIKVKTVLKGEPDWYSKKGSKKKKKKYVAILSPNEKKGAKRIWFLGEKKDVSKIENVYKYESIKASKKKIKEIKKILERIMRSGSSGIRKLKSKN